MFAAAMASALFVGSLPLTASAALARPPVVQRDANNRGVVDISANGAYALTADAFSARANKRVNLVTNTSVGFTFEASHAHLTSDGLAMVFESTQKLVTTDTNGVTDIYRYTFSTKKFVRIVMSHIPANWFFELADVNDTGTVLAFRGSNGVIAKASVWLYDTVLKVWRNPDALFTGNRQSSQIQLNGTGRLAAFTTYALAGCTKCAQVWLYNWTTNSKTLISVNTLGKAPTNGNVDTPSISPDGRYVSFRSNATGFVAGLTTIKPRVYVRDRVLKVTKMITEKETTDFAPDQMVPGAYAGPMLGTNGKYLVVLENRPTKFSFGTVNATQPILYQVSTKAAVMLDKPAGTVLPNNFTRSVLISAAGKSAVFTSQATNFTTVLSKATQNIDRVFKSTLL
jgi:hypothetical protein